ncbi:MAG: hypothetical protein RIS50_1890 [Bacteroidota bacterium]
MKGKLLFLTILSVITGNLDAQITNTAFIDSVGGEKVGKLSISGWMDAYYAKSSNGYWNQTAVPPVVPNLVSSSVFNAVDINLAYLDFRYSTDRLKIRMVPAFGSYMDKNYTGNNSLRQLMEASLGFKPFYKKDIWIEAGLIGSPFTNENPVSRDQLIYSRSLAAEYSPYYLTGAKVTAPLSSKLKGSFYVLNGWQTIYEEIHLPPAMATQLEFTINKNNLINWNVYFQDRGNANRFFSDIYWIGTANKPKVKTTTPPVSFFQRDGFWCNANFSTSYNFTEKSSICARVEYFQDLNKNIYGKIFGTSLGFNKKLYNQLFWRTECKLWLTESSKTVSRSNVFNAYTSIGIGF